VWDRRKTPDPGARVVAAGFRKAAQAVAEQGLALPWRHPDVAFAFEKIRSQRGGEPVEDRLDLAARQVGDEQAHPAANVVADGTRDHEPPGVGDGADGDARAPVEIGSGDDRRDPAGLAVPERRDAPRALAVGQRFEGLLQGDEPEELLDRVGVDGDLGIGEEGDRHPPGIVDPHARRVDAARHGVQLSSAHTISDDVNEAWPSGPGKIRHRDSGLRSDQLSCNVEVGPGSGPGTCTGSSRIYKVRRLGGVVKGASEGSVAPCRAYGLGLGGIGRGDRRGGCGGVIGSPAGAAEGSPDRLSRSLLPSPPFLPCSRRAAMGCLHGTGFCE